MQQEEMAIGDLKSSVKGSAARANAGKPIWSFMPLCQVAGLMNALNRNPNYNPPQLVDLTNALGWFQSRGDFGTAFDWLLVGTKYLMHATDSDFDTAMQQVIRVWELGEIKYAKFNWMKGMPWSETINSGQRHVMHMYNGEELDSDSNEHHAAHYICNAMMALHFVEHYPAGNDLPVEWFK